MADLIRNTSILGGLLLILLFVTSLIPGLPGSTIQFFSILIMLPIYACGSVFLISAGIARAWLLRSDWRRSLAAGLGVPAILVGALLLSIPTLKLGNQLHIWTIVTVGRSWLDGIVAEAQNAPGPAEGYASSRDGFIPYIVDQGPPIRVVFESNPGFLDNWSGIVFDPTGKVMQARGWDAAGKFYADAEVTELFRGDIVSCRHLRAEYYYCSFT